MAAAFRAFVATRPAVFLVAYFAVVTFGLAPTTGRILSDDPFSNLPVRFDAGWYATIAIDGYQWDGRFTRQANIAFFPALPALMQSTGQIIGSRAPGVTRDRRMLRALWAGVFISLASFFVALIYLSRLSRLLAGANAAAGAPLLLAAYPFAAFFNAPYTEGLFLLGAVGAFYHFHRERWVAASLFGLLVGLSRPNGCFVSVPLAMLASAGALHAVDERSGERRSGLAGAPGRGPVVRRGDARDRHAGVHGLSALADRRVVRLGPHAGGVGQDVGDQADGPGMGVADDRRAAWRSSRGVPFDTLNTLAVLFVLAMFWSVLRRLGPRLRARSSLLNLVPPIFAGGALSMGRITSTLFPVFIALAARLPRQAVPAWVAAFAVLQGLVAALFFTWRELF